jgi:hypothetical protein
MLKQLVAFLIVISISFTHANAATDNGLKAAFDELNYSLSVDWDQKDQDFYSQQMKAFSSKLMELQNKGLTRNELVMFVKSEVQNEVIAKDLETAFNMVSINKMTSEDATKFMVDTMKKSYSNGASWNGQVVLYIAIGVLIIAAVIALGSAPGPTCSNPTTECSDTGNYHCYYDMWGERWCDFGYECTDFCN